MQQRKKGFSLAQVKEADFKLRQLGLDNAIYTSRISRELGETRWSTYVDLRRARFNFEIKYIYSSQPGSLVRSAHYFVIVTFLTLSRRTRVVVRRSRVISGLVSD